MTLVQQQASVLQGLQADVAALRSELTATRTELATSERELLALKTAVDFSVRLDHNLDDGNNGYALGNHQTVVFKYVISNAGNAYSPTTGIFTAPMSGTYVFFLSAMCPNKVPSLILAIVKHDQVLDLVFSLGAGADQGSSQVITHMQVGEQVWVRQDSGSGVRASYWTIFTGFLQHADL